MQPMMKLAQGLRLRGVPRPAGAVPFWQVSPAWRCVPCSTRLGRCSRSEGNRSRSQSPITDEGCYRLALTSTRPADPLSGTSAEYGSAPGSNRPSMAVTVLAG